VITMLAMKKSPLPSHFSKTPANRILDIGNPRAIANASGNVYNHLQSQTIYQILEGFADSQCHRLDVISARPWRA